MPDGRLPDADDDERVEALQAVLRRNGVGGAPPFTIQGEIEQMGHTAFGTRRRGWRRVGAWVVVGMLLGVFLLAVVVTSVDTLGRLLG